MFERKPAPKPVLTPCIGVCTLGEDGLCEGCFRNSQEIGSWALLDDRARLHLMEHVLPEREAARS